METGGWWLRFLSSLREPPRKSKMRSDGRQVMCTRKRGVARSEERGAGELDSGSTWLFRLRTWQPLLFH